MDPHVNTIGIVSAADLKEKSTPLELASKHIDSYLEKDERYPDISHTSLRTLPKIPPKTAKTIANLFNRDIMGSILVS